MDSNLLVTQQHSYDLLIVGAGPTGASLAIALGQLRPDLRVCLVDRTSFPRDKVCGDALGPEVLQHLQVLGADSLVANAPRVDEVELLAPNRSSAVLRVDAASLAFPYGVVIRRSVFDADLLQFARKFCDVWEGFRVDGLNVSSDEAVVSGIRDGQRVSIQSRIVVGADGAYSTVRKLAKFPRPKQFTLGVAIRGYGRPGPRIDQNRLVLAYLREILPGYGWVFPVADGSVNVGIGVTQSDLGRESFDIRKTLSVFVEQLCEGGILACPALSDVRSHRLTHAYPLRRPTRGNVILLGDAAGMMNSLSGEGIAYGMSAAWILANALSDTSRRGEPDQFALERFAAFFAKRHRVHYASNFLALQVMRRERFASGAIRAAVSDPQVLADAVRLMFGNGRLTVRSSIRIARSVASQPWSSA